MGTTGFEPVPGFAATDGWDPVPVPETAGFEPVPALPDDSGFSAAAGLGGGVADAGVAAATGGAAALASASMAANVAANSGLGSGSAGRAPRAGAYSARASTPPGRVGGRARVTLPRRPRKWLTFSTGSQSSKPSLQQCSSSSGPLDEIHACASGSVNGPSWLPSSETYHSSCSDAGGRTGASTGGAEAAGAAPAPGIVGAGSTTGGADHSVGSSMPSRTEITAEQFLQRILRILPRTRSSAIEYRVLQRSQRNFKAATSSFCRSCAPIAKATGPVRRVRQAHQESRHPGHSPAPPHRPRSRRRPSRLPAVPCRPRRCGLACEW